jgi:hypothetical protein
MNLTTRETAIAESYPTFWDTRSAPPISQAIPLDDAYAEFVNLTEEELPQDRTESPRDE